MRLSADVLLSSPVTREAPTHSPDAADTFTSPRTPQNKPSSSSNRRLVQPLLQQRRHALQQQLGGQGVNAPNVFQPTMAAVSARYIEERLTESNGTVGSALTSSTVSEKTADASSSTPAEDDEAGGRASVEDVEKVSSFPAHAVQATAASTHYSAEPVDEVRAERPGAPAVHCPPILAFGTGSLNFRATQPPITRIDAARPRPLLLPHTDNIMSLASYPSNLSFSPQANSSASSSFVGISTASKPTIHLAEGLPGPKLSSPSAALSEKAGGGTGMMSGRPAPLLLRSSFSTHTLYENASPSSSSSVNRARNVNGPPNVSPQLRMGPTPLHRPSSTASVTSGVATPLSSGSNRSNARPSFLRTVSAVMASSAAAAVASCASVSQTEMRGSHDSIHTLPRTSSGGGTLRAVNGRVLASPRGARRPELSARRTIFDRSGSAMLETESPSCALKKPEGDLPGLAERSAGQQGSTTPAAVGAARVEPTLTKEMRSFVLGQYRNLQLEVRSLPTTVQGPAAPPVQSDVTAASFVHIKRRSCPRHSKAAKRAAQQKMEEERLRVVQQQHHDMEIIRNGGREQVGQNMKSSTMLAGSLSKLRSRYKSGMQVGGSAERVLNSLDRTISAAFESDGSPFESADEVNSTVLYGGSPLSNMSPERLTQQPSETGTRNCSATTDAAAAGAQPQTANAGEEEAWHSSKFFKATRTAPPPPSTVSAQSQDRQRNGRTVNKNGMKGEAIVVAVMPDSDDDDDSEESDTPRWSTHLTRTKGNSSRRGDLSASAPATARPAKRAGELLFSKSNSHAPPSSPSLAKTTSFGGDENSSSSSDDDACFSFNKLRSQRFRSNLSLSSTQPLDRKNLSSTLPATSPLPPKGLPQHQLLSNALSPDPVGHRPGKMPSFSKELSFDMSGDDDDDDDDEDACCFCCPCKRPENFFALCHAGSQNGSFAMAAREMNGPERVRASSSACLHGEKDASLCGTEGADVAAASTEIAASPPDHNSDGNDGSDSRVVLEDLENDIDDDEPLLSMQSFRRTSIQRVR